MNLNFFRDNPIIPGDGELRIFKELSKPTFDHSKVRKFDEHETVMRRFQFVPYILSINNINLNDGQVQVALANFPKGIVQVKNFKSVKRKNATK